VDKLSRALVVVGAILGARETCAMQDAISRADRGAELIGHYIEAHDLWGSDPDRVIREMLADLDAVTRADVNVTTDRRATSHVEGKPTASVVERH
jgi:hypothetical protein